MSIATILVFWVLWFSFRYYFNGNTLRRKVNLYGFLLSQNWNQHLRSMSCRYYVYCSPSYRNLRWVCLYVYIREMPLPIFSDADKSADLSAPDLPILIFPSDPQVYILVISWQFEHSWANNWQGINNSHRTIKLWFNEENNFIWISPHTKTIHWL